MESSYRFYALAIEGLWKFLICLIDQMSVKKIAMVGWLR